MDFWRWLDFWKVSARDWMAMAVAFFSAWVGVNASEGGISAVMVAGISSSIVCLVMAGMRVLRWSEARGKFFCAVSRMSLLRGASVCASESAGRMRLLGLVVRV